MECGSGKLAWNSDLSKPHSPKAQLHKAPWRTRGSPLSVGGCRPGGPAPARCRSIHVAMGQNPNRTPSEHPNPTTKIGSKMGGSLLFRTRLRDKNGYPKWNPGQWNPGGKPGVPRWSNFDPHPQAMRNAFKVHSTSLQRQGVSRDRLTRAQPEPCAFSSVGWDR